MKIDPLKLKVASGKDPHRYPLVSESIENQSIDNFKLEQNKMIVDITKKITQIIKRK